MYVIGSFRRGHSDGRSGTRLKPRKTRRGRPVGSPSATGHRTTRICPPPPPASPPGCGKFLRFIWKRFAKRFSPLHSVFRSSSVVVRLFYLFYTYVPICTCHPPPTSVRAFFFFWGEEQTVKNVYCLISKRPFALGIIPITKTHWIFSDGARPLQFFFL